MEGTPTQDLRYLRGLRDTVSQGVEYGIQILETGRGDVPALPAAFYSQPRLAARRRIPLDIVLRRVLAGKTLLAHYMFEEAANLGLASPSVHAAVESLEITLDCVLNTAQQEYRREEESRTTSPDARLFRTVQRLLDGEERVWLLSQYAADGCHLGVVTTSPEARPLIRSFARSTGCRSLVLTPYREEVWAWLGSEHPIDASAVCDYLTNSVHGQLSIGVGRSEKGAEGWRLTHQQAKAAAALGHGQSITIYEDVALLVALSRDPLLAVSLNDMYLEPLSSDFERGQVLRDTLRAYFEADRNGSSAAAALGVSRQTVANRLEAVEDRLNRPLTVCGDLLHAALRLEELGYMASF